MKKVYLKGHNMEKKLFLIGGWVRDELIQKYHPELNIKPHDKDYVAIGYTEQEMDKLYGRKHGKSFPVWVDKEGNEIALARTEEKIGNKHTDFKFTFNPNITLIEDCMRRNHTINAIAKDIETGEIIDVFGGIRDIKNKVIRCINPETFKLDPLRVIILCRQVAQLGFNIDALTLYTCKEMVKDGMIDHLTPERIWKEFEKALATEHFDYFIKALKWAGALKVILPEVSKLFDTLENPDHHPEGNSGEHTLLVLDKAKDASPMMKFALLLHDVGKGLTPKEELPKHIGHEERGLSVIETICDRLRVPNEYKEYALMVCKTHMLVKRIADSKPGTIYDFIDDVCKFKDRQLIIDMFDAARYDLEGRDKTPSEKNMTYLKKGLEKCLDMFDVLKDVKADMFPELERYNGKEFGEMLRVKKIQHYIDNK